MQNEAKFNPTIEEVKSECDRLTEEIVKTREDRDKWKRAHADLNIRHERSVGEIQAYSDIIEKLIEKLS